MIFEVTITLEKGIDLGLMIRGGIEYGLGIYVTRVEQDSLADKAGLRVNTQRDGFQVSQLFLLLVGWRSNSVCEQF